MAEPITVNIDGIGAVNFPADYTPERIKIAIERDILPRVKGKIAAPAAPDAIEQSALDAQKPSRIERLGRGFADVTQGATQLFLNAKDAVTSPSLSDVVTGTRPGERYTQEKTAEEKLYEKGRGADAGIDWLRLGGNVAATAPAMLIPGGGAATLGTRVASGAAQGGASSAVMFTPEGESKLEQVLVGAGIGSAVPVVLRAGQKALTNLAGKFNPQRGIDPTQLQGELSFQLQKEGINFNSLTKEVQESLLGDAKKALESGKTLDAAQAARQADIQSVGAKGTQAAATRDPKDWQTMMNLRGVNGVGEEIGKRQAGDAQAMTDYLARLRTQTGGKATTAFEAGEAPIKALQAADEARNKVVDSLYDAYRAIGGKDTAVPAVKVADALGRVADEIGAENIPPAVLTRLKEFGMIEGKQTKLLTINEADKLNKLINNNNPGKGTPGARALQPIKEALNESLLDIPETGASEALLTARKAAANMFAERRASAGVTAAVDDVAPDRFVKKFIVDAPVKDMRETLAKLKNTPDGAQALADVKGHLFDQFLLKATGATNVDDVAGRAFSGRSFAKALDAIPPEKLHALFTPSEVESLRTLQRASKYLTEDVPFSDVNHSKTTAALANILQKIGSTPMLGQMLAPIIGAGKIGMDWVKDLGQRKAVAEMLVTSAGKTGEGARLALPAPNSLTQSLPAAAAGVGNRFDDDKK